MTRRGLAAPADDATVRLPTLRTKLLATAIAVWGLTGVLVGIEARWPAAAAGMVALLLSLGLLASLLLGRRFVAVAVRGQSMAPTLRDGDWVLVRRGRAPARGQVIVVAHPETLDLLLPNGFSAPVRFPSQRPWLVKRVAAVPGDPVPRERVPSLAQVPEHRVPPGKLVLLGDNQRASFDSRRLGYFSSDTVLGAVVRRLAIGRSRGTG